MADTFLSDLLRLWEEALACGENPTPEQLCREHPERIEEVRRFLAERFLTPPPSLEPTGPQPPTSVFGLQPVVPGFEILGVLGRGGMAVVYQARQIRLKRLVALKVIRSGDAADPLVARFRTETEAVARFQHPNIVQIHEVGEYYDAASPPDAPSLPYCVLEFVGGGTLAQKLAGQPQPISDAARIAETLARAVHYAHQHNVVHRDLKPANVLLTPDGEPKVADFGLAKNLDDDVAHTQTGQVMGTPSYMAPEQAEGRTQDVGPPADVWALGAILYEMLTGRPPFRGGNVAATLEQVRTQEPVPPSLLNPATPRDLEVICLKCLRKETTQRYKSALLLAQDLERFRGGEPILARPEGLLSRLRRRMRGRVSALVTAVLAIVVFTVAAIVAVVVWNARTVSALQSEIEVRLDAPVWTPALVEDLEQRIDRLAVLAPRQADDVRIRLQQRYHDRVKEMLDRPRLESDDMDAIAANLTALAQRDPEGVVLLQQRFRDRQRVWESVVDYTGPLPITTDAALGLEARQGELLARELDRSGRRVGLLTEATCRGNVQIEAVFDASWSSADALALLLDTEPGAMRGYAFVLGVPPELQLKDSPFSMTRSSRTSGLVLEIRRDGVVQRKQMMTLPTGPLTLRASRVDNRLSVQVNGLNELVFIDAFPLPSYGGRYGLVRPPGVQVERLYCRRQTLAPTVSPLESADEDYANGRFAEALGVYERQALVSGPATVGAEARYKAALCLLELNRPDEADGQLERVAAELGDRWPPLAALRLWLLRLERGQQAQAEEVFLNLRARYRFSELIAFLPEAYRQRILREYSPPGNEAERLVITQEQFDRLERAGQVIEYLDRTVMAGKTHHWLLLRACQSVGKPEQALALARSWMNKARDVPVADQPFFVDEIMLEYVWMLRAAGRLPEASVELDRWMDVVRHTSSEIPIGWLLERVRQDVAANDWDEAECGLYELVQRLEGSNGRTSYLNYSNVFLMLGFLRERRGDRDGALEAWKAGTEAAYTRRYLSPSAEPSGAGQVNNIILATFVDQLDDAEAARLLDGLLQGFGKAGSLMETAKMVKLPATLLREMWKTPRGRECARQMAFRTESFAYYSRTPMLLLGYEMARRDGFGGVLTTDQDTFLWRLCSEVLEAYYEGRLGNTQLALVGSTWRGTTTFLGWGSLSPQLRPEFRGPLAYLMGHRYRRLAKPKEAEMFFRTALADAAADSSLKKLAEEALKPPSP